MNELNTHLTVLELKLEAHQLINVIARKSSGAKLLLGLLPLLKMYAQYKTSRGR